MLLNERKENESIGNDIEELLARPEDTLQRAVDYIPKKNAEPYRRLA